MENNQRFTRQFLLAYYVMVMARKNFLVIAMLLMLAVAAFLLPVFFSNRIIVMPVHQGSSIKQIFPSLLFN